MFELGNNFLSLTSGRCHLVLPEKKKTRKKILMQSLFSFDQGMRDENRNSRKNSRLSTLVQLLFSFEQDMRVEKTFMQTLDCQLSLTLVQLLFSFDQDMRVEKTSMQTLDCQLSSTLVQLLFSFEQDMRKLNGVRDA